MEKDWRFEETRYGVKPPIPPQKMEAIACLPVLSASNHLLVSPFEQKRQISTAKTTEPKKKKPTFEIAQFPSMVCS